MVLAVLPLVEKSKERAFSRRPLAMGIFALFLLLLLASLVAGMAPVAMASEGGI